MPVQRTRPRLLLLSFGFCLMLFVLTPWTDASYAQPELFPSEQYPGPWVEVPQEVRDLLARRKISACSEAVGRKSSRNPNEYLLYCTQYERHWTSWRVQPAAHKVQGPGKLFEGIPAPNGY
jgi:hypothetical protein